MENKLYIKNTEIIRLLPHYFKWIGLAMILLTGLLLIGIKLSNIELLQAQKETLKIFSSRFFLLGVLIITLAKDKFEDELTSLIRLKAMGFTFILVIGVVITQPIVDWIWKDPLPEPTPIHLILRMLVAYHILFFFLKKFR